VDLGNDPYAKALADERTAWYEVADLVRQLSPSERMTPGYYRDPSWSVRDLVGHLGAWLAEAALQLDRIVGGTYEGHDVDIDGLNATFLEAMRDQPWEVAWLAANAGRTRMLQCWVDLGQANDEAAWWIAKSGAQHYAEHLDRLRAWVGELAGRRTAVPGESEGDVRR
jgi:hypothetical protein